MSVGDSKAVFLSYASQDADAARRIGEALRSAGVEVWFDADGGLEHGDEWDVKIRRQIKECVLFIAVISGNTQARHEGYFRIEWDLAAERARGIASGVPFILPVVIDETHEADALVPDRFRAVQWTRLPGGVVTPQVQQRLIKLWSHRIGVVRHEAANLLGQSVPGQGLTGAAEIDAVKPPRWRWWVWVGSAAVVCAALAVAWWTTHSPSGSAQSPPAGMAPPGETREGPGRTSAAQEEAQKLIARARAIYQQIYERDQLELAQDLARKATELDPASASGWATRAHVEALFLLRGWAPDPARVRDAQSFAHRAIGLNAAEPDALVALGLTAAFQENPRAAEEYYRRALAIAPDNHTIRRFLGIALRTEGRIAEALAVLQDAAQRAPTDALMHFDLGLVYQAAWDWDNAWRGHERAFELRRFSGPPLQLAWLAASKGDIVLMRQWIERIDVSERGIDSAVFADMWCGLAERNLDHVLTAARRGARDYLENENALTAPKRWFTGLAYRVADMENRARQEWASTEVLLRERQRAQPGRLHAQLAITLALLGRADEAAHEIALLEPMWREQLSPAHAHILARYYAVLGDVTSTVALLRRAMPGQNGLTALTGNQLRLDPWWDRIRATPEFEALLADPPRVPAPLTSKPAPATDVKGEMAEKMTADRGTNSLAVLAFANLSGDKENEYFSDGISEELLNVLAKVPGLRVAARTSAFYFKGKNATAQEIGQKLGVAHLVEGSVQKSGNRVKITARLSRAAANEELWSKSFGPLELTDVFATQGEIAQAIVAELRGRLTGAAAASVKAEIQVQLQAATKGVARNPEVHTRVLQARHAAAGRTVDGLNAAIKFYREAIVLAPAAAEAWGELAYCYQYLGRFGGLNTSAAMGEARVAARKALEFDPQQPHGLAALGWVQRTDERDWRGAVQSFRRVLAAAPGNVTFMSDAAVCLLNVGHVTEAMVLTDQAVELDPLNPQAHWARGIVRLLSGKPEQALAAYRRAVELAPTADEFPSHLSRTLTDLGRIEEAKAVARTEPSERYRLIALAEACYAAGERAESERFTAELIAKYPEEASYVAQFMAKTGRVDEAFQWLERAYQARSAGVAWVKINAYLDNLHSDPRWDAFLRRMGLADDQLR